MAHGKQFVDEPMVKPELADKAFKLGIALAVIGAIGCCALFMGEGGKRQFFFSYLTAFATFTTISLGCLFFVILHHLTRAMWGTGLRRIAENIASAIPVMALLFIPILIGMHDLYHWSHPEAVEADPLLQGKQGFLNAGFFIGRSVVYIALWVAMAIFFRRNSVQQDANGDVNLTFKMRWWAPMATLAFALSISYAGFDWLMSLDPHWFSTMFGVIIFAGSMVSGYATIALMGLWLTKNGELKNTLTEWNFHDTAKLMWGFGIFWAYVSFSQYFLQWYSNIPEETAWYVLRAQGGWGSMGLFLLFGHFVLPFLVLLSRHMKRNRLALGIVASWMLFMHYIDLYYMIMPTLHHHLHFTLMDLFAVLMVGGIFLVCIVRPLKKDAVVAHNDPMLVASMNYDNF
jgi:hypothetical protein